MIRERDYYSSYSDMNLQLETVGGLIKILMCIIVLNAHFLTRF